MADTLLRDFLADDVPGRRRRAALRRRARRPSQPAPPTPGHAPPALAACAAPLTDWLARVGATDEEAREITVAVNEVAANAIEHAYGLVDADFVVEADQIGDVVEFVVRDFGQWRKRRARATGAAASIWPARSMDTVDVQPGVGRHGRRLRRQLGRTEGDR